MSIHRKILAIRRRRDTMTQRHDAMRSVLSQTARKKDAIGHPLTPIEIRGDRGSAAGRPESGGSFSRSLRNDREESTRVVDHDPMQDVLVRARGLQLRQEDGQRLGVVVERIS